MQRKLNILSTEPTVSQLQEGVPQLCKIGEGFFEYVRHGNGLYRKQWDVVGADTSTAKNPTYFSSYRSADVSLVADSTYKELFNDLHTTDSHSGLGACDEQLSGHISSLTCVANSPAHSDGVGSGHWGNYSYEVQNGREGTYFFSTSSMFKDYAGVGWISVKIEKTASDTAAVESVIFWNRIHVALAGNYDSVSASAVFDMKGGDYVKVYAAAYPDTGAAFTFLGISGSDKLSTFSGFRIGD